MIETIIALIVLLIVALAIAAAAVAASSTWRARCRDARRDYSSSVNYERKLEARLDRIKKDIGDDRFNRLVQDTAEDAR